MTFIFIPSFAPAYRLSFSFWFHRSLGVTLRLSLLSTLCLSPQSETHSDRVIADFGFLVSHLRYQCADRGLDMILFKKGLGVQSSALTIRPRPFPRGVRSLRARQPQRHSSSKPQHAQGSTPGDGSPVTTNTPPQSKAPSSTLSPSLPNTAAAAAGAATTPAAATATRSRGVREALKASRLGQFGRWYSDVQARKPYATQLWSSVIIYLCGDLSAQLMFPSEKPSLPKKDENESKTPAQQDVKEASRGGYDPWRTVRHLAVGVGSSIPSYKW